MLTQVAEDDDQVTIGPAPEENRDDEVELQEDSSARKRRT